MENVITVSNLSKSYSDIKAVDNISIKIKRGEVFGLLGANGAGKSTTIECILGTKEYDSGIVNILNLDPVKNRNQLFQKVSVQFQESCYQDRITVLELCQVTEALYEDTMNYRNLLEQFGLEDKEKSFVCELSGGERQRLFIILALIPNPEIVFFDELTTGLDVRARRDVWKYLLQLKENGMTLFLTSHFMDEVEVLCDRIAILKKGEMIFKGETEEAIENSPFEKLEDAYLWYIDEEGIDNENI